jgi:Na+-driven multidrug efflux pump
VAETGGTAASAGYQIAFRIFVFFILPSWGLSNAAATLVGQNLGARRPDRAEESVVTTMKFSLVLMVFVTAFLVGLAPELVRFFTQDVVVLEHGIRALRIIASGFIFYGVAMVIAQALNGAGDTKAPTRFNLVCFWVFQIPLAYFLARGLAWGPAGAVAAVPLSQALFAVVAWRYFKRGAWQRVQV